MCGLLLKILVELKVCFTEPFCPGRVSAPFALVIQLCCACMFLCMGAHMYVQENPSDIQLWLITQQWLINSLAQEIFEERIKTWLLLQKKWYSNKLILITEGRKAPSFKSNINPSLKRRLFPQHSPDSAIILLAVSIEAKEKTMDANW